MKPLVIGWLKEAWEAVKPDVADFLDKQFDKWMPKLIAAATVAMTQIGAKLLNTAVQTGAASAEDIVEHVTNAVPTEMDDRLADAFLGPIFDRLKNFNILPLTAVPPKQSTAE